jgi:hypothetical protein
MYGPAVRRKRFCRAVGSRSCINVFGLCLEPLCSRPSWISARLRSHYRTGLDGPFGSPVFACAGKTDPPFRLFLSQTSVGSRHWIYIIAGSSWVFVLRGRSFVAASAHRRSRREHGASIKRAGRAQGRSCASRSRGPWPGPPRRCGQACWRARLPARCDASVSSRLRSKA